METRSSSVKMTEEQYQAMRKAWRSYWRSWQMTHDDTPNDLTMDSLNSRPSNKNVYVWNKADHMVEFVAEYCADFNSGTNLPLAKLIKEEW